MKRKYEHVMDGWQHSQQEQVLREDTGIDKCKKQN
jgi:hypothetical protein